MIYNNSKTIKSISYSSLIERIFAMIFGEPVYFPDGHLLGYKFGKYVFLLKEYCNN